MSVWSRILMKCVLKVRMTKPIWCSNIGLPELQFKRLAYVVTGLFGRQPIWSLTCYVGYAVNFTYVKMVDFLYQL